MCIRDSLHIERRIHAYDLRMPAADQQAEEREAGMGQFAVGQVDEVREDMPLQVVDLDHRDVVRHREPLGERYPDEQRTQQPGAAREGDGIDLPDGGLGDVYKRQMMFCWCAREASSGITPPYFMCTAWEAITFDSSRLLRITAADVSSHEDSMPRIVISIRFFVFFNYFS